MASGTNPFGIYTTFKYHVVSFVPTSAAAVDSDVVYSVPNGLSESAVFYSTDITADPVVWCKMWCSRTRYVLSSYV